MHATPRRRAWVSAAVVMGLVISGLGFLSVAGLGAAVAPTAAGGLLPASQESPSTTLPSTTFVLHGPAPAAGPDDLTLVPASATGRAEVWTQFQNEVNPNGTAGTSGGPTSSTLAGYVVATGALAITVNVSGHVDGLTWDPIIGKLIVTANEDANSRLYLVNPVDGRATLFSYDPSPNVGGNGGTDSIAIWHGGVYISHSDPNDATQPTVYRTTLDFWNHVAYLASVFPDDAIATNAVSGVLAHMALTDPDTNFVMPVASPLFAGALATISQGDGVIVFASHGSSGRSYLHLSELHVADNVSGNVPPIDGLAVATSARGTLYVVDSASNTISALRTNGWPAGTVFVTEPNDNGNPLLGTLNLFTGKITPLGNTFTSPKGLLFLPAPSHDHDGGSSAGVPNGLATFGLPSGAIVRWEAALLPSLR